MSKDILKPVVKKTAADTLAKVPPASKPDAASNFIIKPPSVWMKESSTQPVPKMLFGELWFQGEWCILFADSGIGKSILSVQIADAISSGHGHYSELFPTEVKPQPVLYFDFELSSKQFEKRYSNNYNDHYGFSSNMLRAEVNRDTESVEAASNMMAEAIEAAIIKTGASVCIIDNITAMTYLSTDSAKDAMPIINQLMRLKNKFGISLLTLHHTPKRDKSQPITDGCLAGSKMFSNFCDSAFALGVSGKDEKVKYIKQIKVRSADHKFGGENVIVCSTEKHHNFLAFDFAGTGSEREHLKAMSEKEKTETDAELLEYIKTHPDTSYRTIAADFKVHHSKVQRLADRNGLKKNTHL